MVATLRRVTGCSQTGQMSPLHPGPVCTDASAYALTDNERAVTAGHAQMPVRNPKIVQVARQYGMTLRTCVSADPQSKGGRLRRDARHASPSAANIYNYAIARGKTASLPPNPRPPGCTSSGTDGAATPPATSPPHGPPALTRINRLRLNQCCSCGNTDAFLALTRSG